MTRDDILEALRLVTDELTARDGRPELRDARDNLRRVYVALQAEPREPSNELKEDSAPGGVRLALAESLSAELDIDMSPKLLAATDRLLVQLWLRGVRLASAREGEAK